MTEKPMPYRRAGESGLEFPAISLGLHRTFAAERGQSLANLAISWLLRNHLVTTAIVGASSVGQLDDTLATLDQGPLSDTEFSHVESLVAAHPEIMVG